MTPATVVSEPDSDGLLFVLAELRQLVAELALVSHASSQSYDVVRPGDDVPPTPARWRVSNRRPPAPHLGPHRPKTGGSRTPTGAPARGEDHPDYRQKSAEYFEQKLLNCWGPTDIRELLTEAQEALIAWRKTPVVPGMEPERGTFRWKCMVADDRNGTVEQIAKRHSVNRRTLFRYRARYTGLFKVASSRDTVTFSSPWRSAPGPVPGDNQSLPLASENHSEQGALSHV